MTMVMIVTMENDHYDDVGDDGASLVMNTA